MSHRPRLRPLIAVSVALVAALATPALARVPRVGVVIALSVNVDDQRAADLAAALADALHDKLEVETVAGAEAAARMPSGGLPDDCVATPACIQDIGTRLDADELLLLVIAGAGDGVSIDPTWVEVASGRAVSRASIVIEAKDDLVVKLAEVAQALLPDARLRAAVEVGPEPTATPQPVRRRGRHLTRGVWISGGIAAAALVAGTAFGLLALSAESDAKDAGCDTMYCPDIDDRVSTMDSRALIADLSFIVAAGAGTAAVIMYLRSGGEALPVDLSASPQGAWVRLHGRF